VRKLHDAISPQKSNLNIYQEIIKVFYFPTDAQENFFKKNIKIYIKRAPTCFGAITTTRERIFDFAKVTFIKIIN
jgi:hypothetical protein